LEYAGQLKAKLESAEASATVLISNPTLKAARRAVEKKITMWVSQISGTQQQVRDKSMQLIEVGALEVLGVSRQSLRVCFLWAGAGGGGGVDVSMQQQQVRDKSRHPIEVKTFVWWRWSWGRRC
jgi:hypothetical protein